MLGMGHSYLFRVAAFKFLKSRTKRHFPFGFGTRNAALQWVCVQSSMMSFAIKTVIILSNSSSRSLPSVRGGTALQGRSHSSSSTSKTKGVNAEEDRFCTVARKISLNSRISFRSLSLNSGGPPMLTFAYSLSSRTAFSKSAGMDSSLCSGISSSASFPSRSYALVCA